MSQSQTPTISPESQKALRDQQIQEKINELTNLSRLVVNTLNLVCSNDITIPSAFAGPVSEIQQWLTGMHKNIGQQLEPLKALLPQPEATKAPVAATAPVVDAGSPTAVPLTVVAPETEAPKA